MKRQVLSVLLITIFMSAMCQQTPYQRKLQAEREAYKQTDEGIIMKNIALAFNEWQQKGEFEKVADHAERLKQQSQSEFHKICLEQIEFQIDNMDRKWGNSYRSYKLELLTYDSESEFFEIIFKANGMEGRSKINIPIAQAKDFKDNWQYLEDNGRQYLYSEVYGWYFIENELFPSFITRINTETNSKYEFTLSLKNAKDIICSFDSLGISNPYLKGYIFNYSKVKAIEQKRERLFEPKG